MSRLSLALPRAVAMPRRMLGRGRLSPATALSLLGLTVLAVLQRPGRVTFDTKLDLAANPISFLARALHLWNPMATSGELQNQAYGYFFPIGPFFAIGQALGVPPWVTQRAWTALLLCGAFLGVLLLARAMRIGSEPTRYAAAFGYALAPRMLTEVGLLSSEMLAATMLPWVLLPLVTVDRIGSRRRAAALSGLAVLGMSGVNAAVVLMALVLPGLWMVTRRWDFGHVRFVAWWCISVVGATLWWIIPLRLLGQYSMPFFNFVESSTTTTAVASLFQATRGTNQWVAYMVQGEPWWPAGWMLVDNPALMALTAVLAAAGLAGLACRGLPEQRFLVLGFVTGLTLMTIGYVGTLDSPFSAQVRDLMDGPLAPFRNVHKLDPVVRLPLMLGLAYLVPSGVGQTARPGRLRWRHWLGVVPVLLLIAGAAAPAWLGQLRPGPGWSDLPAHWRQATAWLGDRDPSARTLVVPGSGFGQYSWGRTMDEPIQSLAEAPWALRNQIPLGSAGNTRVMDTVESVLAQGRGSAGLADFLARAGYRYVLLRNDIDRTRVNAPPVTVMRRALDDSPGLVRAAAFGPPVRLDPRYTSPVDDAMGPVPAIEIYEVQRSVPRASAVLTDDVVTVSGGPESLLSLLEQGLVERDRPAVLAGDVTAAQGQRWIVTDGLRRRERDIGRVRDNLSETLTATETGRLGRAELDVLPFDDPKHQTVATYQGIRSVTASTSVSFVDNLADAEPSYLPFAAVDGDPGTVWHSAPLAGPVGQWLEVTLDTPRRVDEISLEFVQEDLGVGWPVTAFRITTDQGSVDHQVAEDQGDHRYYTQAGITSKVRVTVLGVLGGRAEGGVGIRRLAVPDTMPYRALRVPADLPPQAAVATSFSFSRGPAARSACFAAPSTSDAGDGSVPTAGVGEVRCDRFLARVGEEPLGVDRIFQTATPTSYRLRLTALYRPDGAVPFVNSAPRVTATASSHLSGDPEVGPYAAVDGDPATAWLAGIGDGLPTLRLAWPTPRRVGELRLRPPGGQPAASLPRAVEVRAGGRSSVVPVGADGLVRFPAVLTDRLEIAIRDIEERIGDRRLNGWVAPVGIAEVEVPALADLIRPLTRQTPVSVPCGQGPAVHVDDVRYDTAVRGTLADVLDGRPLPVTVCDQLGKGVVDLRAGDHRLRTETSESFVVQDAWLTPIATTASAAPRHRAVSVLAWDPTERTVRVGTGDEALLVVPENANGGWRATLAGRDLPTRRVDGWQQAWVVPAGDAAEVRLTFLPDRTYRTGLAVGALTVLAVLVLALWPARRPGKVVRSGQANAWVMGLALVALLVALGGWLPVVVAVAVMLLRQLIDRSVPIVVGLAVLVATAVAVAGRLSGHGQDLAYGTWAQAAMLVAVGAVVASAVPVPGWEMADEDLSVVDRDEDGTVPR